MHSINIIGAGRVGTTLLRLFGSHVNDVASARFSSAEAIVLKTGHARATHLPEMSQADLWVLTVPDDEISKLSQVLATLDFPPAIAIHCSGFHVADEMAPLRAKGWHLGSAHPNLSFADPETAATQFAGTYVGLEGDPEAFVAADDVFTAIGAKTFSISTSDKALYHAAAVVSNNFTTVLQGAAQQIWAKAGVPNNVAAALGDALLRSAAENVATLGPAAALTGPASRGDRAVVEVETQALTAWNDEAGQLYADLSKLAARLKRTGQSFDK